MASSRVPPAIDAARVIALTRSLVRVSSENPPGREEAVARVFAQHANEWGLHVDTFPVGPGRVNLLVTPGTAGGVGKLSPLVYCGHLDTVPVAGSGWRGDPLGGQYTGGRIRGRGSVDMKGGLAGMLAALAALAESDGDAASRVALVAVAGEEVDCAGSLALVESCDFSACRWLVIGEPTGLDLVVRHKGALHLRITVQGRSAHGARPERGVNAVRHMCDVVAALDGVDLGFPEDPLLGEPTLSVNQVTGGAAVNVVPDTCTAAVDIRTLPGQDHHEIVRQVEDLVGDVAGGVPGLGYEVEVVNDRAWAGTDPSSDLIEGAQEAAAEVFGKRRAVRGVPYYSDASVLQPATGLPVLLFGPGETSLMHQVNESVAASDLVAAARFFSVLPTVLPA